MMNPSPLPAPVAWKVFITVDQKISAGHLPGYITAAKALMLPG